MHTGLRVDNIHVVAVGGLGAVHRLLVLKLITVGYEGPWRWQHSSPVRRRRLADRGECGRGHYGIVELHLRWWSLSMSRTERQRGGRNGAMVLAGEEQFQVQCSKCRAGRKSIILERPMAASPSVLTV